MVEEIKIKEGYKKTEVGLIPEDWEVKKLVELIDYTKGFAFKSADYRKDGIRIIRVSDTDYNSIKDSNEIYIDVNDYKKYEKWSLSENDIILSTVGSKPPMYNSMVGKAILVNKKYKNSLLNQNAVMINSRNKKKEKQLLLYYNLKTERYLNHIEEIFRGNANQASITLVELFKFEIPIPKNIEEQKAIANVLTDTDNLITSLEKLIDKKERIKQGTMQELLTGKKRLDGFSEDWEVKKLGELSQIATGNTPPTNNPNNYGDEFMFVSPFDLGRGKYIYNTEKKLSKEGFGLARKYPKDSILVTCIGSTIGKIGMVTEESSSNQQINAVMPNNAFSSDYVYYYLSLIVNIIRGMASEQAVPIINKTTFESVEVLLPPLSEQEAIADILSDMDKEISLLEEKLDKYKTIKQGMMQELLTGRTRLI